MPMIFSVTFIRIPTLIQCVDSISQIEPSNQNYLTNSTPLCQLALKCSS